MANNKEIFFHFSWKKPFYLRFNQQKILKECEITLPRTAINEWFKKPTTLRIILLIVGTTTLALLFDLFGLGAGSIGSFTFINYASNFTNAGTFIILLYSPLLSSDGGIGVLSSRLGTGLHLGSIQTKLLKNTESYYTLISAVLTLGTFNGLWIGLISYITNLVVSGTSRIFNPLPFIVIPILTLTISSAISSQITSLLAFFVFKKKLDPDTWVYPTMSTINNILSTLFYALMIVILQPKNWFTETGVWTKITAPTYFMLIPVGLYLGFVGYIISRNYKKKDYLGILKQAMPIQSVTLTINSLTGGILSAADKALTNLRGLFLIYPALIDTLGDECTITSNTTSTNLALGSIPAKLNAITDKDLWTNLVGVGISGLILHLFYGILGSLIVADFRNMGVVIGIALGINIFGYLIVQSVIYFILIIGYRKGLDPDNIAVPIIASLSNLVCSALILLFTLPFGY